MKNSIINTTNKSISDIDDILGKLQNTFISAADIGLIKVIWKNINNKNGTTQIVNKWKKLKTVGAHTHNKS